MNVKLAGNEGTLDRAVRIVVGIALIAAVFVGPHTPLGWLGLIPLVTGFAGTCPAYGCLGVSTCSTRSPEE